MHGNWYTNSCIYRAILADCIIILSHTQYLFAKTVSVGLHIRCTVTACPRFSLPPLALRHEAHRILGWALLPSAAKKVGLDPPVPRLTLSYHANQL